MTGYLPVNLRIEGRPCLVAGGGEVAARKVRQLARSGADILVIAPELCNELQGQARSGAIRHEAVEFYPEAIGDQELVIAATSDKALNRRISELARERHIPVNVVDEPGLCSFIMPSIVDRDPVQVAVSTGGASPVLARLLRARLETLIPSGYGQLANLMRDYRERVRRRYPEPVQRRRFWEQVLQGPVVEMLLAGQDRAAMRELERVLGEDTAVAGLSGGEVYLVGGGPGDPDLLTFRALRLMQQADVVLYDRLVHPAIVDLVRREAERVYVGKERDRHALPQEEINRLLIELARQGKRVLRLKGGDPFIFGRGGEEIEQLADAGIPFQVVPGITAAAGCASYAGIPLTHRNHAQSCVFVTGHMKDGRLDLNWDTLVRPGQTIAVYMGLKGMDVLAAELIRHGMDGAMPVAVIQQGTTVRQKVYISSLKDLPVLIESAEIKPPSMVIIGRVVQLHEKLAWFEPAAAKTDRTEKK